MNCKLVIILLLFFCPLFLFSQQEILDNYVSVAIQNNISLQREQLNYKKSQLQLKVIKRKFLPSLLFRARYTRAAGGRDFDIPLGDFFNPVYQNLNLLNSSVKGLDPAFSGLPPLSDVMNEQINFIRRAEHETHLRVEFPILNLNLIHTQKLQQLQLGIEEKGLLLDKRKLTYEVRKSYYDYLKIKQLQTILSLSQERVDENLRAAKSLVEHHRATKDYIYSVETEVRSVEKEIVEISSQEHLAKAYFNLLLNRPIDEEILLSEEIPTIKALDYSLEEALGIGLKNRLELGQLDIATSLAEQQIKRQKSNRLPELNFRGDYGYQGTKYGFGSRDDYAIGSLVLSWELWNPETGPHVEQAKLDKEIINYRRKEIEQKIQMEVLAAFYEVETVRKSIVLAQAKKGSAEQAYRLVNKKFKQGQANVVELSQARTQLIQIEKEIIISTYELEVKLLDFKLAIGQ